ncbi:MAG TPA: peroxiredoxin [Thiotrichales bacterium]|nr:peroxiredoxin [Thiotrichales bacterium]
MADKLLIILVNTGERDSAELSAPFIQATVAATMEYEVEVLFSGGAGSLARRGVASSIALEGEGGSLLDLMRGAHEAGVLFKACAPAVEAWGEELIDEIDEVVGAAYLVSEAMSDGTVTFTY